MKTKFTVVFFLLVSGITFGRVNKELDSLRQLVLTPKIEEFQKRVNTYTELINGTSDKLKLKSYAKQIIDLSNDFQEKIKELYGYRAVSSISPVYVGQNVKTVFYPNIGGFIFPVRSVTVGSLPGIYDEVDYIKDYAWRIRLVTRSEVVKKNLDKINKKNSSLAS